MKETDLYVPLKKYFEAMSYHVQAEVLHLDFLACHDERCVGIELKLELSTHVIAQAIKQLSFVDTVYIATLKPLKRTKTIQDKHTILKALGIGLIYVDMLNQTCEIAFDPQSIPKVHQKKHIKLKKEFHMRTLQNNQAGMTKQKVMTYYKESLLLILSILIHGERSIRDMKAIYDIEAIQKKLYVNYYGWFESVSRGVYRLTDKGVQAYHVYKDDISYLVEHYKKRSHD